MSLVLLFFLRYLNEEYGIMDIIPAWVYYVSASLFIVYSTSRIRSYLMRRKQMRASIQIKQQQAEDFKSKLEQTLLVDGHLLPKEREEITSLSVKELLQRLQDKSLSCLEVMKAYQSKALEITKQTNCITEFITEAQEWACQMDQVSQRGPLHGLPISIKDNVGITSYDSTTGISIKIGMPAESDAAILAALRGLGAIPFCKTNIPQTMLSFGCGNPIWGLTTNPFDKMRTPGGSSGGEGCLIGAGGSPLGIGSDIGGSARAPAAFCGIPSIKPTSLRMSYKGFSRSAKGCVGVPSVPGLMARDVDTVILVTRLLLDQNYHAKYDPDVLPIPWNEQCFSTSKKLRIGYYEDDGFFPTTPGMRRALQTARDSLERLGHELIPFSPTNVDYVLKSFTNIVYADECRCLLNALSVEDIDPVLKIMYLGMKVPYFIKRIVGPVLRFVSPRLLPNFYGVSGYEVRYSYQLWDEIQNKNKYREDFLSSWREKNLDLCIAPPFACPAPLSKDIGRLVPAGSYTILYNFLDLPVGIVPVTKENQDDQTRLKDYNHHNDVLCKLVQKTSMGALGMPLCVQVIGLPYEEERVFQGMNLLDSALRS